MEIKCTKKCEKEYPKRLLKMENAPDKLYYLGDILLLDKNIIALIGKRDVSEKVMKTTKRCGEILAECGTVVLNGLAIGCDTAGLEGALTAGGKCIAVMPCGLDKMQRSIVKKDFTKWRMHCQRIRNGHETGKMAVRGTRQNPGNAV